MKKIVNSTCGLAAAFIILTAVATEPLAGQQPSLPSAAGGWTRTESVDVYAGTELFELINGGADLFFEYGFVRVATSTYSHPPDEIASAELYEMKSTESAFGLFTSFTAGTGTAVPVGQEAVLGEGYCLFWKGQYVGMLSGSSTDPASAQKLLQLARGLEAEIHQTGPVPDICELLREGGIESRTMVFVRGGLAISNHLSQVWAEPLPPADGVVGKSGRCRYLILEYPDTGAASAALRVAAASWEGMQIAAARNNDGTWRLRQRSGGETILSQLGTYVVAASGEEDASWALISDLRRILGGN